MKKREGKSAFFSDALIVLAGSFFVNVLNYVFTLVMGRLLGPSDFGELATLFSLLLILGVPATAITLLIAQIASRESLTSLKGRTILKYILYFSLGFLIVFAVAAPFAADILHVRQGSLLFFALMVVISYWSAYYSGILQGAKDFMGFSLGTLISTFLKLALGLLAVYLGFRVVGILGALIIANLAAIAYTLRRSRSHFRHPQEAKEGNNTSIAIISVTCATFLLALLGNQDVVLASTFLPKESVGLYAALSTLGKTILYGVTALTTVMFPYVSREKGSKRLTMVVVAAVFVIALTISIIFGMIPEFFVQALFGTSYLSIAPLVGRFSLAIVMLSVLTVLANYFMAKSNLKFLWILGAGAVLEAVLIGAHHATLADMVGSLFIALGAATLLLLAYFLYEKKDIHHHPSL